MAEHRLERVAWDDERPVALRRLMDADVRERDGMHDEPAETMSPSLCFEKVFAG